MDLASRLQAPPKNLRFLPADCLTQFVASQGEDSVLPKPGLCLAALPGGHETLAHGSHGTWHTAAHGSTTCTSALLRLCCLQLWKCGWYVNVFVCVWLRGYRMPSEKLLPCRFECLEGNSSQLMFTFFQDLSLCSKGKGGGKGKKGKGKGKHMWKGCRSHAPTQSQEEPATAAPAATEQSPIQSVEARWS